MNPPLRIALIGTGRGGTAQLQALEAFEAQGPAVLVRSLRSLRLQDYMSH